MTSTDFALATVGQMRGWQSWDYDLGLGIFCCALHIGGTVIGSLGRKYCFLFFTVFIYSL